MLDPVQQKGKSTAQAEADDLGTSAHKPAPTCDAEASGSGKPPHPAHTLRNEAAAFVPSDTTNGNEETIHLATPGTYTDVTMSLRRSTRLERAVLPTASPTQFLSTIAHPFSLNLRHQDMTQLDDTHQWIAKHWTSPEWFVLAY